MKRRMIIAAYGAVAIGLAAGPAPAGTIRWFNNLTNRVTYAGGGANYLPASTNPAEGCFLQLVYAGGNRTNDLARCGLNTTGVTADDVPVACAWFGRGTGALDPLTNGLLRPAQDYAESTRPSGAVFYVRVWAAPAFRFSTNPLAAYVPLDATHGYADSALLVYQNRELPLVDSFNFAGAGLATTQPPNRDTNQNGMPDWWEMKYFTNASQTATNAYDDLDGDGQVNLHEYWADTIPNDSNSCFGAIAGLHLNGQKYVELADTSRERYYDLVWRSNLTAAGETWQPLDLRLEGTGGTLWLPVTNAAETLYLRAKVSLP